ncbi:MAG: 4-hydroxythreonine-4-phosphate dehydrogenase PdxA [Phycisphaeraceae bacterium]|nr:4-hydroxythreonine-4-phosphate dehydrogenase PdxA [Phycisphaeraceae bacterium]
MSAARPLVGITMGDPAGVGPEIAVKALAQPRIYDLCRPVCYADADLLRQAVRLCGVDATVHPISDLSQAKGTFGAIDVFQLPGLDLTNVTFGKVSPAAGHAAFVAVTTAIEAAMKRQIAAVVTGPLHKEALRLGGHDFPGHTEIFAHFTGSPRCAMMLAEGHFRVVHVSTHVSLRKACDAVTIRRVLEVIDLAHEALQRLGVPQPKIGVAGLNPHAGDGGLFGDEEELAIQPAIEQARQKGYDVQGPFPPDTFYPRAITGVYDVCVAMYHDQGHIPVKLQGFHYDGKRQRWNSVRGINITLGLPIIRTSVDHGTAFDLAGRGIASEQSMIEAIDYAARLAKGAAAT